MTDDELLLYSRQMLLPTIGIAEQQKLLDSTVMVVGVGGLGCSVLNYLTGSGVGTTILVDHDVIELSNLPRQILFYPDDIGTFKSATAAKNLLKRCPDLQFFSETSLFSEALVKRYKPDVIIDAGDDLALSYQLDNACQTYGLPLVHASVSRFEGHSYTRLPNNNDFPSLKKLFPQTAETESCSQTGVMTVAVGLLGAYQATQAVRVLVQPSLGNIKPDLVIFNGNTMGFSTISLKKLQQ